MFWGTFLFPQFQLGNKKALFSTLTGCGDGHFGHHKNIDRDAGLSLLYQVQGWDGWSYLNYKSNLFHRLENSWLNVISAAHPIHLTPDGSISRPRPAGTSPGISYISFLESPCISPGISLYFPWNLPVFCGYRPGVGGRIYPYLRVFTPPVFGHTAHGMQEGAASWS